MFHFLRKLAMENEWNTVIGMGLIFSVMWGLTFLRRKINELKHSKHKRKIVKLYQKLGDGDNK